MSSLISSMWHRTIVFTLSTALIITAVPTQYAMAAASEADKWEEIKEDFDLVVPNRRGERFSELYFRIETRLSEEQKEEIAELNKKLKYKMASTKMPTAKTTGDTLVLKEEGQELTIKVQKDKDNQMFITVNGRALTEAEAMSPLKTYEILEKMTTSSSAKDKTSWLFDYLVPKAHALSWGVILGGIAAIGAVGYMIYKKKKDKANACKKAAATCCAIAGAYTQLSDGCCSKAGGLATGMNTCPSTSVDGTIITPVPTTNTESSGTGVK